MEGKSWQVVTRRQSRPLAEATSDLVDPEDFPALYQSANLASLKGQTRFLRYFRARLLALLVASLGGVVAWRVGGISPGAAVGVLAFMCALAVEFLLSVEKPERLWYQGRAAAESAKTLTWRFVVGGGAFEASKSLQLAQRQLIDELANLLQDLEGLNLIDSDTSSEQISAKMISLRALPFDERKDLYKRGRIEDQRSWYAKKAVWNAKRTHSWEIVVIVCEFCGILFGTLNVFGVLQFSLLGILSAIAAATVAWVQAKQHRNLSTAYAITSQELASIAAELDLVEGEEAWSSFVDHAEEAISREHTLWRASRGIKIPRS